MVDYEHDLHPHAAALLAGKVPVPTIAEVAGDTWVDRLGLRITQMVGTMTCAAVFAVIALISLPTVLKMAGYPIGFDFGSGTVILIAWIAQTFLQLVLLSVIMVGQSVQAKASDGRADLTYKDAEAVLHECLEIQKHLEAQDKLLSR